MDCAAELAGSQAGTGKLSRKERTRLKKEAKRQLRKAGSDDEDLAADMPAFKVRQRHARVPVSPYMGCCMHLLVQSTVTEVLPANVCQYQQYYFPDPQV